MNGREVRMRRQYSKYALSLILIISLGIIISSCYQNALHTDERISFQTAQLESINDSKPFSFIVYGDTKDNIKTHEQLIDAFFKEKRSNDVAFIVHLGDMVVDEDKEYYEKKKEWKEYFIDIVQSIAESVPYFPTVGNHDYDADGGKAFADLFSKYYKDQNFWYSFVYGNSIFIILDANLMVYEEEFGIPKERIEKQYHWLKDVLKSASNDDKIKHKFVFFHQAPFVSAQKRFFGIVSYHLEHAEKLRTYQVDDEYFLDIFRKYGIDAVFTGHVHYYERWVEQYERENQNKQINWITTAGGGAKNALVKWHGITLGKRPPKILTKKEKAKRIRPYNLRAKQNKEITNWKFFQGYPAKKSETETTLENHYCIVHVNEDSIYMEVKNKKQKRIEKVTIKSNR